MSFSAARAASFRLRTAMIATSQMKDSAGGCRPAQTTQGKIEAGNDFYSALSDY